ncbi:hypothetical protein ACLB2K_021991 [Fragaria x ananassa]
MATNSDIAGLKNLDWRRLVSDVGLFKLIRVWYPGHHGVSGRPCLIRFTNPIGFAMRYAIEEVRGCRIGSRSRHLLVEEGIATTVVSAEETAKADTRPTDGNDVATEVEVGRIDLGVQVRFGFSSVGLGCYRLDKS